MISSSSLKGVSFGPNWLGKTLGRRWDWSQDLRRGKLRSDRAECNPKSIPGRRKGTSTGAEVEMRIVYSGRKGLAVGGPRVLGGGRTHAAAGAAEGPCHTGQHRLRSAESEKIRFGQHAGSGLGEGTESQWRRWKASGPRDAADEARSRRLLVPQTASPGSK